MTRYRRMLLNTNMQNDIAMKSETILLRVPRAWASNI